MRSNQIQFTRQGRLYYILWVILTDEEDEETIMEYIKTRLFKREPERDELRRTSGGWKYEVYVR